MLPPSIRLELPVERTTGPRRGPRLRRMATVPGTPPIRVMVIDDEALVRSGFDMILGVADDIEVVGTADGVTALQRIDELRPDVVLLDIRMPGRNGLEVLQDVRAMAGYDPVVAILTTFDTDDHIAQALGLERRGFLVKDTDPVQLPTLVRSLAAGGVVLSHRSTRPWSHGSSRR